MAAQLPAGPVVRAVDALCQARSTSPRQLLDPVALRAYTRAAQQGSLTVDAVERLCAGPLRADPHDLYGDQYDRAVTAGRGAAAEPVWLDAFRDRAGAAGMRLPGEGRPGGGAEVVPAEELSGRRAVRRGDEIMADFGGFLEATGHGPQLRALLGPAVDQLLVGDDPDGPDRPLSR